MADTQSSFASSNEEPPPQSPPFDSPSIDDALRRHNSSNHTGLEVQPYRHPNSTRISNHFPNQNHGTRPFIPQYIPSIPTFPGEVTYITLDSPNARPGCDNSKLDKVVLTMGKKPVPPAVSNDKGKCPDSLISKPFKSATTINNNLPKCFYPSGGVPVFSNHTDLRGWRRRIKVSGKQNPVVEFPEQYSNEDSLYPQLFQSQEANALVLSLGEAKESDHDDSNEDMERRLRS